MTNLIGAYNIGEDINATKLEQQELKSFSGFQPQSIRSLPTWKGKTIEIPKGTYGGVTFDVDATLQQGMPLPGDVKDGLLEYFNDTPNTKSDALLKTYFGTSDRNALKKMIVDDDWILGAGIDEN